MKFYPYKRFCHAGRVGGAKSFGVVLTQEHDFIAILKGVGHNKFPPFKRGGGRA